MVGAFKTSEEFLSLTCGTTILPSPIPFAIGGSFFEMKTDSIIVQNARHELKCRGGGWFAVDIVLPTKRCKLAAPCYFREIVNRLLTA